MCFITQMHFEKRYYTVFKYSNKVKTIQFFCSLTKYVQNARPCTIICFSPRKSTTYKYQGKIILWRVCPNPPLSSATPFSQALWIDNVFENWKTGFVFLTMTVYYKTLSYRHILLEEKKFYLTLQWLSKKFSAVNSPTTGDEKHHSLRTFTS